MTNSISLLNKVGSEVSVGQSIGAQNAPDARSYASHNLTLSLIISICWGLILFVFAEPIMQIYKLEPAITAKSVNYLRIVATAFPFIFLSASFTGIYNASGQSKIPFMISGIGLLLNMILDPLFIFGFGWNTEGAAIATWVSQATVLGLFIYRLKKRKEVLGGFAFFTKLESRFVKRIFKLGLPVAILNTLFSIINLFMARTASIYGGHIGLMTLTAGGQLEAIAWNTSQGFSTALSAFVAQNYAAGKNDRVLGAYATTLKMTAVFGTFCTLLFVFWGSELFSLIVPDPQAYKAGGVFLRIDGYSMLFMMLEITTQGLFYGTGRTIPPAVISIGFNTLRIPLAMLLASIGMEITGVWWAISLTSIAKGITSAAWFAVLKRRILVTKGDDD